MKENHQTTSEEIIKRRKEQKKIQKQPENKQQNDNKYISINNHVKCSSRKVADWFKKDPSLCYLQKTHSFRAKDTHRLKVKRWKKIFHANVTRK